jgi:hypothetical protein
LLTQLLEKEWCAMSKKVWMASLALALIATTAIANVADARRGRKCPKGYEDVNGICVPDPTPGAMQPLADALL